LPDGAAASAFGTLFGSLEKHAFGDLHVRVNNEIRRAGKMASTKQKGHFFSLINRLKARGVSIIFITHNLEEALQMADRITILRDGELVGSGEAREFDRDRIVRAMVGRTLSGELYRNHGNEGARPIGKKVLSVQNLSMGSIVTNTSFSICKGQITGMSGLIGSGRTETAKIISGVERRNFFSGGEIRLFDKAVYYRVPRSAMRDGIVYVTEDRKDEGFFEAMTIAENLFMGSLAAGLTKSSIASMKEIRDLAADCSEKLNIKAIDSNARVIELSGGNQQKVVISKSLVQKPKLIIFDEPTRGVEEFSPEEATEEKIMYAAVH
jgi:simple sugar transport system ATP-binding protein